MKKILQVAAFVLLAFGLFTSLSWADEDKTARQGVQKQPLLWKVKGKDIYIFGTIHRGVNAREELAPIVWEKFRKARIFVMESNIHQVNQLKLLSMMQLPPGRSLDKLLSKETWKKLTSEINRVPPQRLKRFRPWVVSQLLVEKHLSQKFLPMDMYFLKIAQKRKYDIGWLESWQSQIQLLNKTDNKESIKGIEKMVDNPSLLKKEVEKLEELYLEGNPKKLASHLQNAPGMTPQLHREFLIKRNERWMKKIEKYLNKDGVFIAVGAGHLVGKKSVIKLLEKKGYKVVRLEREKTFAKPKKEKK